MIYSTSFWVAPIMFDSFPDSPPKQDLEDKKSSVDLLLDSIFAVDPKTLLPRGDVSQYLSKDTPDDIRSFIEKQLFNDKKGFNEVDKLSGDFLDLPDDFVISMQKSKDETNEAYLDRLNQYLEDTKRRVRYESYARRNPE